MSRERYAGAGVDLSKAEALVEWLRPHVDATRGDGFQGELGGFGGRVNLARALGGQPGEDAVMVSTTDGVGTKVRLASMMGLHEGIGQDCVAMCVNDLVAMGARPLFFLDYIGVNSIKRDHLEALVRGMSTACITSGCMMLGGETAEMRGMYQGGGYEAVGFCVGMMREHEALDVSRVAPGDRVVAFASSGPHSNGFSLLWQEIDEGRLEVSEVLSSGETLGETLLRGTRLYVEGMARLREVAEVKSAAHVTGGGVIRALERLLPAGVEVRCEAQREEEVPEWAQVVMARCGVSGAEGAQVWNMGVGFFAVVRCEADKNEEDALGARLREVSRALGYRVWEWGVVA